MRKPKDDQSVGSFRPTTGLVVLLVASPRDPDQEEDLDEQSALAEGDEEEDDSCAASGDQDKKETAIPALSKRSRTAPIF